METIIQRLSFWYLVKSSEWGGGCLEVNLDLAKTMILNAADKKQNIHIDDMDTLVKKCRGCNQLQLRLFY